MKRFAQLSKKIREIMDLLSRQGGPGDTEQDAMFSKKPLGPQACASCEKNLTNMYGQAADYHVWKKLPFRDPSERIARYGQGFSKILSHMRPSDLISGSPGRGQHHQSIDDTRVSYNHGHSTSTDPAVSRNDQIGFHPPGGKTYSGFYRQGKTAGGTTRGGGYITSTTNPGSSIDEVNMGPPPEGFKSPSARFNQDSHRVQGSAEVLPKLGARSKDNSANK